MKKSILAIIICSIIVLANSCKKEDTTSTTNSALRTKVKSGTWKVTLYNDSGDDHLSYFSGYEFTFNTDGTIEAIKTGSTISGTWTTGTDDSNVKFILNFGSTTYFDEISDDWHVIEQTDSKIQLEDISGGNGGTDLLTFEKI